MRDEPQSKDPYIPERLLQHRGPSLLGRPGTPSSQDDTFVKIPQPQHATERFEFRDDLRRPLRHFVIAQCALLGLEFRVKQD